MSTRGKYRSHKRAHRTDPIAINMGISISVENRALLEELSKKIGYSMSNTIAIALQEMDQRLRLEDAGDEV
jgi:hypothetical protein